MNDARRRRPLIKKRARESKNRRLEEESKILCRHGDIFNGEFCQQCNPIQPVKPLYRGWVYLKDGHDHRHVIVDIPADRVARTVHEMHTNGFWGRIVEGDDYTDSAVFWVAPHEIRRIIFWSEDAV